MGELHYLSLYIDRHSNISYIDSDSKLETDKVMVKIPSDFIRGHIDTIILKLLLDNDKYGYEISKTITAATQGEYELHEATMYSSLKRLEQDGYVKSYWGDESQGGRRKYYTVTTEGTQLYYQNKRQWEAAKRLIDQLI